MIRAPAHAVRLLPAGLQPLADARSAGHGRVTSPAVQHGAAAVDVSLIWVAVCPRESMEPLNPNKMSPSRHLGRGGLACGLAEEVHDCRSAKTSPCDRHPRTWDSERLPSHSLQDNASQPTRRGGASGRDGTGATDHLNTPHARLSGQEGLDSACRRCAQALCDGR
jgi:hypothetical protein